MTVDTELREVNAVVKPARLTTEDVWRAIEKRSFAIVGYETPRGDPRSSGVMYKADDRRLYIAVDPERVEGSAHRGQRPCLGDRAGA